MFKVPDGGQSFSWGCCVLLRCHTVLTLVFICFADNAYQGLSRIAGMQHTNNDIPQALSGMDHIAHHWQLSKSSRACRGTRLPQLEWNHATLCAFVVAAWHVFWLVVIVFFNALHK